MLVVYDTCRGSAHWYDSNTIYRRRIARGDTECWSLTIRVAFYVVFMYVTEQIEF
jgi:hypothetical protein